MKSFKLFMIGAALTALSPFANAESTITLTGVHNCCSGCTRGIEGAITKTGASAEVDDTTVTITARTEAEAQKAAEALVAAGYYGEGATAPAVTDARVKSAKVSGVHLCCGKCVSAVKKAIKTVAGANSHTAEKGAASFTVEGDFSTKELAGALNKAGFSGRIQ